MRRIAEIRWDEFGGPEGTLEVPVDASPAHGQPKSVGFSRSSFVLELRTWGCSDPTDPRMVVVGKHFTWFSR